MKRTERIRKGPFLLIAVAGAGCAHDGALQVAAYEKALGSRSAGVVEYTTGSSTAQRLVYIVKTATGEAVVLDGVPKATYASIPRNRLSEAGLKYPINFSPDGKRIAYVAIKDRLPIVVVDETEGSTFDRIAVGAPVFSPDSRRVAYFAERGGRSRIVIDGVEGEAYDAIGQMHPRFTSDSKHVFYTARRGQLSVIVLDGKEIGAAEYVGDPVLSDSGGRFAYVVNRQDAWSVVVDGVEGKRFRHIGNNLVFSKDGRRFLYRGGDSLDYVVVDGVQGPGFGSIQENSYAFSPNGAHVAFAVHENREAFWVLDGRKEKAYDWVSTEPAFSPDGRRLTYVAERSGKRFVVIGGQEGQPFDDITTFPEFAPDGRVIFIARRGTQQYLGIDSMTTAFDQVDNAFITAAGRLVVVARRGVRWNAIIDGAEGSTYEQAVGPFATSPDGKRIAYAVSVDSGRAVVVDGARGRAYDEVEGLSFTGDGRHVMYTAKRLGKYVVVVDGTESLAYDEILSAPSDDVSSRTITVLVRRGTEDLRVELEWKGP